MYRRIIKYSILMLAIFIYMVASIDYYVYNNYYKKRSLSSKTILLEDFDNVLDKVSPENLLESRLYIIDRIKKFAVSGFDLEVLDSSNNRILKNKALHPSQNLALFSMGFLSDYLLENYHNHNLDKEKTEIIEDIYLLLFKEINNPFSRNPMTINDHVVSERIEFIVLFRTFLEKYYPDKRETIKALSKDFNLCLNILKDDKHFTWQTNHGIMQLRSLAHVVDIICDNNIKKEILNILNKRIGDIIPYFIGNDGAIYESASGYWSFIQDQFVGITEIESIQHLSSVVELKNILNESSEFINTIATNDGFMQGMGDSYSFIVDSEKTHNIDKDRIFRFSNNIAGYNWSVDSTHYSLLFTSLYTPPNVHKLPEDLSVYLYINGPFFSNTGTYSYNNSKTRVQFKTDESSHSGIYLKDNSLRVCDSSRIEMENHDDSHALRGVKFYGNDSIVRRINVEEDKRIIKIIDSATVANSVSQFLIYPKCNIEVISENKIIITNEVGNSILFESISPIQIVSRKISPKSQLLKDIEAILIDNTFCDNTIIIKYDDYNVNQYAKFSILDNKDRHDSRRISALKMASKYKTNKSISGTDLIKQQGPYIIIAIIIFILIIEIYTRRKKKQVYG